MKLYLMWCHGEDGPEELRATTNRSMITDLLMIDSDGWSRGSFELAKSRLDDLMQKTDAELSEQDGIHPLMRGWGGLHLQVTDLFDVK